jgi:hypothetical protein
MSVCVRGERKIMRVPPFFIISEEEEDPDGREREKEIDKNSHFSAF